MDEYTKTVHAALNAAAKAVCKEDGNDWDTLQTTYSGRVQARRYDAMATAGMEAFSKVMATHQAAMGAKERDALVDRMIAGFVGLQWIGAPEPLRNAWRKDMRAALVVAELELVAPLRAEVARQREVLEKISAGTEVMMICDEEIEA